MVPALEMNGKEKEIVHQKKWAFNLFLKFWRVSDNWIVAGSLFHDAGPVTANARSPKLVFERGMEIAVRCRAESRTSSYGVWSAELTELFWCSAACFNWFEIYICRPPGFSIVFTPLLGLIYLNCMLFSL